MYPDIIRLVGGIVSTSYELFACPIAAVFGKISASVAFAGHANPSSGLPSGLVKNSTRAINV